MTATTQTTAPTDKNRIHRITDSTGRVLGVRRASALQRLRLLEAVGAETSRNRPYLSIALVALAVTEIDGELCEPVATKRQLEARISQLDDHGLSAAGRALRDSAETADQQ